MNETTTRSGRSRAAKMFFLGKANSMDEPLSIRQLRASADPEGAETQLLDEERHY